MIFFVLSVAVMLFLILGGTWIAISLGFSGVLALLPKLGDRIWDLIGVHTFTTSTNFVLLAVPLFVFMGEFMGRSGTMDRVYKGLAFLLRGGGAWSKPILLLAAFLLPSQAQV